MRRRYKIYAIWAALVLAAVALAQITAVPDTTFPNFRDLMNANFTSIASALAGKQPTLTAYSTISALPDYPTTFPPVNSGDWAGTWQMHTPGYFQTALGFTPENVAHKGQVNGYPGLDANGNLPIDTTVPVQYTIAAGAKQLPAAAAGNAGQVKTVSDGTTLSDCTVGGGSAVHQCYSTGSEWTSYAGGGSATPGLGLVATLAEVPNGWFTSGDTWLMARTLHIARDNIAANTIELLWQNFTVTTSNVETGEGQATYKVSIEYPSGTIAGTCTFGGVVQPTVVSGANALADYCPHSAIPVGARFWVRVLYQNSNGILLTATTPNFDATNGAEYGGGAASDKVTSGTVNLTNTVGLEPSAIIAPTLKPSVCIVGDSRAQGYGDGPTDLTADTGEIARWVGPVFAYSKIVVYGSKLQNALANFTGRMAVIAYCSHVVDAYGVNDVYTGTAAATVAGYRASFATLVGKPVWGTTVPLETTSTDSWATTGNQTAKTNTSIAQTFNGLIRAGIAGEFAILDVARAIDPTSGGLFPVSPNLFATSGTAGYCTTDGVHESAACNALIAQYLGYTVAWMQR